MILVLAASDILRTDSCLAQHPWSLEHSAHGHWHRLVTLVTGAQMIMAPVT